MDCGRYSTGNRKRGLWWMQDEGIKTLNFFRYSSSTKIRQSLSDVDKALFLMLRFED